MTIVCCRLFQLNRSAFKILLLIGVLAPFLMLNFFKNNCLQISDCQWVYLDNSIFRFPQFNRNASNGQNALNNVRRKVLVGIAQAMTKNKSRPIQMQLATSTLKQEGNYRIFFHETSGRKSLNLRQNCAVESAAKENPLRSVELFLTVDQLNYSDTSSITWLSVLQQYNNIQVKLINETEYFAQSPLESWYREGVWRTSPFYKEHLADYIRMLSLFKNGGLYMDLDFITLKPLDDKLFWNFFSFPKADRSRLTNSIFHLEHGHGLIKEILRRLAIGYDPNKYDEHGPVLVTETLTSVCGFQPGVENLSFLCNNVRLVPHQFFYPIPFSQWEKYFKEADAETFLQIEQSYAVHVWNKVSSGTPLVKDSNQLYLKLAAQHCPLTIQQANKFDDT